MLKLTPSGKSFSTSSGKCLLANVFWQMSSGKYSTFEECIKAAIRFLFFKGGSLKILEAVAN